ncbi:MAG: zinc ABC transporter substrate-binding protein [Gammaproteobacteria bacterium]|nr:zinc ABC transporter substrate-binding protein [Gammaproteobacteria bacterium]
MGTRTVLAGTLLAMALAAPVQAKLNVLTCEPELAALAEELGGTAVKVSSATTGHQDPHRVEARPSLIARTRRADLLVCTGGDLEIGWLPLLLRNGHNAAIQPGTPGHFLAFEHARVIDVPVRVDRSEGDVHPYGNPHLHLDPENILHVAAALAERLQQLVPEEARAIATRHQDFETRWRQAMVRWETLAAPLKGKQFVAYHTNWNYLRNWLGFEIIAFLEPKPGVPPSAAHLARVLAALKGKPVKGILAATYQDTRPAEWLTERTGIPRIDLPLSVGGDDASGDLFALYDDLVKRLVDATQ